MANEVHNPDALSADFFGGGLADTENSQDIAHQKSTAARLRLLWTRRRLLFRLAGAGLLVSTLIAFLIPRRYDSTARLLPPDQSSSSMDMAMLAAVGGQIGSGLGAAAGDLLGLKNSSDLSIGILQSRTVQDDLIGKFNLRKEYWDSHWEDARKDLAKHAEISSDRKSGIITITVTDGNPRQAAAMAAEYVQELNRVLVEVNTTSAHRERVFLENRLVQVKQDLESAENIFSAFASKNVAIDVPAQGKAMIEAAASLEGELIASRTQLESLKQIYADNNVHVRATQARVEELQRQADKQLGSASELPATGQADQSVYPSIRALPLLGVSYADLYRNSRVQEAIFETLTRQYEFARVEEAKETPTIKVLDAPDVPDEKSFPPRFWIALSGTLLFVAVGIAAILARAGWLQMDRHSASRLLAIEIFETTKAHLPFVPRNGVNPANSRDLGWERPSPRSGDINSHSNGRTHRPE